ncbi:MAG: hypothetical protein II802_02575, partial [Clostridia bacterium]|nr:hypothetical protein [Clostridia bacterium]
VSFFSPTNKSRDMLCNLFPYDSSLTADRETIVGYTSGGFRYYIGLNRARIGAIAGDTDAQLIAKANEYLQTLSEKIIYYPRRTPTEETIELPDIPTFRGTTIFEVDTTVQPSNIKVIYKGK